MKKKPSYKIIIPSYRRHEMLKKCTLRCLARTDAEADIYIYVADEHDERAYCEYFKGEDYQIVRGVRGIPQQRNFIQRQFPEGDRLLFMDDDLEHIIGLNAVGKRVDATRVHDFIMKAFELTERSGLRMFGINSTNSNLEMQHTVSAGLIYLVGNFYGLINTHEIFVDEGLKIAKRKTYESGKESHERSLLMYQRYGGVLKFRSLGVVSKYWGAPGGHQVSRSKPGETEAALYLHRAFPEWTELRVYKGIPDLVIKSKTKVFPFVFKQ